MAATSEAANAAQSSFANNVKGAAASAISTITKTPGRSWGFAAGAGIVTALVAKVWPAKEQQVEKPDGTTMTVEKAGIFKKATVALGAVSTLGGIALALRPNAMGIKKWADTISKGVAASHATPGA